MTTWEVSLAFLNFHSVQILFGQIKIFYITFGEQLFWLITLLPKLKLKKCFPEFQSQDNYNSIHYVAYASSSLHQCATPISRMKTTQIQVAM